MVSVINLYVYFLDHNIWSDIFVHISAIIIILSCQPRVTVTSSFVYKIIKEL